MKIIILGAGYGGLQAARVLANAGHQVLLFERNKRENIGYHWPMDVLPSVFEEVNLPLPEGTVRCPAPEFHISTSALTRTIDSPEKDRRFHVDGRALSQELIELAEQAGAELRFECAVSELLTRDGKVYGVYLNGFPLEADLVIDSIGIQPKEETSIKIRPMQSYLTVALPKKEGHYPEKKVFALNPLGQPGIAEFYQNRDGKVLILVGRFQPCSAEQLKIDLSKIRPGISLLEGKSIQDGTCLSMSVRSPSLKMVSPGFAAIDKSNFVSDALFSGQTLAETIIGSGVSMESLWSYQVRYYKKIVADAFYFQELKWSLINTDGKQLAGAFEDNLLTDSMLLFIAAKTRLAPNENNLLAPFRKCLKRPLFSAALAKANAKGQSIQNLAENIPEKYDPESIAKWNEEMKKATS